jgi:hypothetical protein
MENFKRYHEIEKVDAHIHYNTDRSALLETAQEEGFRYISINTDIYFFPAVEEQEQIIHNQQKKFGHRLDYISTFPVKGFNEANWIQKTIDKIKASNLKGAVSVKIWKNIGMELKDTEGKLVMIDDPRMEPVFQFMSDNKINFTGHQGEPKNCWLPIEQMTVKQDRDYFLEHPEYHMYLLKEYPSYEEQIQARDNVLTKFPKLNFCGCHFASLEWSIDEIAKRLDKYPYMMVDTAERICHIQHQSVTRYDEVRDFVLKYQDRIIYGTDVIDDGKMTDVELKTHIKKIWERHWKYFTTSEMQTSPKVSLPFRGLDLPWEAIEKIYYKNAKRFYRLKEISKAGVLK